MGNQFQFYLFIFKEINFENAFQFVLVDNYDSGA